MNTKGQPLPCHHKHQGAAIALSALINQQPLPCQHEHQQAAIALSA